MNDWRDKRLRWYLALKFAMRNFMESHLLFQFVNALHVFAHLKVVPHLVPCDSITGDNLVVLTSLIELPFSNTKRFVYLHEGSISKSLI